MGPHDNSTNALLPVVWRPEPRENGTEAAQLLPIVWQPQGRRWKIRLPKWLVAVTLTGTVIWAFSPSGVVTPVMTALAPELNIPSAEKVSSENAVEDRDDHIAEHTKTLAAWRALLEAQSDRLHGQAAEVENERLSRTPQPTELAEQNQPSSVATQTLGKTPTSLAPAEPTVMAGKEAASPPPPAPITPAMAAENVPLPPSRPRAIAVAKSAEPAHYGHVRGEHHPVSQPNVFELLVAQLFHHHRPRPG